MINTVTTNATSNVVVVTAPGPSGPIGPQGPTGDPGTIESNSGTIITPRLVVSGSAVITGSLIVSGSNTFINIGPALFTGSTGMLGNLTVNGTSSATVFSGSGAQLFGIPAAGITGLNLSSIASGVVSASVATGGTAFTLNTGGTNLFTVSNTGLGTFAGSLTAAGAGTFGTGLTVNGSTTNINQGLVVANGATLNGGTTIGTSLNVNGTTSLSGTATLNGDNILTSATVSTNRITDSNISASVSATGKAFSVNNGATELVSVDQQGSISGSGLNITSGIYDTVIDTPNIRLEGNATLNGQPITTAGDLTLNQIKSGAVTASVSTGVNAFALEDSGTNLMIVSSSGYVSASGFIGDGSQLSNVGIIYNSGSNPLISSIEVADFDNNVAVTYVNGNLKFVFGTPLVPSAPQISFSGFNTDRFNLQTDNYTVTASWAVGGYSLVRASMVDLSTGTEVASTTSGTSLPFNTTTSGNQSYRIAVTASSPLDGTINTQIATTTGGTLSKVLPSIPVLTPTADVQLGTTSGIERGATGSISFTAAYGASNNEWERVSLVSSSASPITVTATNTPSVTLTANYQSPAGTNSPTATTSRGASLSYSRIRSVRYGASALEEFNSGQLQDLALWDTTLGGSIGTIVKGTINPNNYQFTVVTSGNYIYIVIDNNYTLTGIINVNNSNANDLPVFSYTLVDGYKVYRSNNESATSILYKLTTT